MKKMMRMSTCRRQPLFILVLDLRPHPYRVRPQIKGLSHGLKTCHWHVFLTAFRVPSEKSKTGQPPKGLDPQSLFLICVHTHPGASADQGTLPRPKNMPLACFFNGLSSPGREIKNRTAPKGAVLFLVPLTGLEPVQYRYRGILSPLCLPIPPQRRVLHHSILTRMRQENHPGGHASRMGFVISAAGDIYSCAG